MNDLDAEGSQHQKDIKDESEASKKSPESVRFILKANNVSIASKKQNRSQENQKREEPGVKGAFGSASTALGNLQLECRKCKMVFRKRDQLANHLEKFCSNSEYADIEQFKMKLLSADGGSGGLSTNNASFNSVRKLLSGAAVNDIVGKTSLANLRLQINSDENSMAEVKSSIRKSREREMIAQLCDMKVKHSQLVFQHEQEGSEVKRLVVELDQHRSDELRARIEKERLKGALKSIERAHLKALEEEKRKEVSDIVQEMESLKRKENLALEEIEKLIGSMEKEDPEQKSRHERVTDAADSLQEAGRNQSDDVRTKFAKKGQELGQEVEKLRMEREKLTQERETILARLSYNQKQKKSHKSDTNYQQVLSKNDQHDLIENLRANQGKEKAQFEALKIKLNAVREDQERVLVVQDDEMANLESSAAAYAGHVDTDTIDQLPSPRVHREEPSRYDISTEESGRSRKQILQVEAVRGRAPADAKTSPSFQRKESLPKSPSSTRQHDTQLQQQMQTRPRQDVEMDSKPHRAAKPSMEASAESGRSASIEARVEQKPNEISQHLASLKATLKAQREAGEVNPALEAAVRALESDQEPSRQKKAYQKQHAVKSENRKREYKQQQQQQQKTSDGHGAHAERRHVQWEPPTAPFVLPQRAVASDEPLMIQQLQQQMSQTQRILEQHQMENARLQQELSSIEMSQEVQRLDRQRNGFEQTLKLMTCRLGAQVGIPNPFGDDSMPNAPADGAKSRSAERAAEESSIDQISRAMKGLQGLPPNSELYEMQLRHITLISKLRFEREFNKEQLELEKIRQENERIAEQNRARLAHEEWMAEQQRILEKQRLNQEISKNVPLSEFVVPGEVPYNPVSGFVVLWDFLYGLERNHPSCRFVYQIIDGSSSKRAVQASDFLESEPDGPQSSTQRRCVCGFATPFQRMPNLSSLKLIVEVQIQMAPSRGPGRSGKTQSLGWSILQLFSGDGELRAGFWKMPLYTGPMRKDVSPTQLRQHFAQYKLPNAAVFVRLFSSEQATNLQAGGDPDVIMHLYRLQTEVTAVTNMNESRRGSLATEETKSKNPTMERVKSTTNFTEGLKSRSPSTVLPSSAADRSVLVSRRSTMKSAGAGSMPQNEGVLLNSSNSSDSRLSIRSSRRHSSQPAPPPPVPKSFRRGVGVVIKSCEHLSKALYARVRVSLFAGQQPATNDNDEPLRWSSSYAQLGASGGLGVFTWEQRTLFLNVAYDPKLRFVMELIERTDRPSEGEAEPAFALANNETAAGWTSVDLFSRSEMNSGVVNVGMSEFPIAYPFHKAASGGALQDSELSVELFTGDMPPPLKKVTLILEQVEDAALSLPWIHVDNGAPNDVLFERGDGFDVYVDACRFLPEDIVISRATLEIWPSDMDEIVQDSTSAVSEPSSATSSPSFCMRREYRAASFDPTCTMEVRIDGFQRHGTTLKLIGVAALNVFVKKGSKEQPTSAQTQEFCLNSGCFQLPLKSAQTKPKEDFFASVYDEVAAVPCATVLLRIRPAARSADMLDVLVSEEHPQDQWEQLGIEVPAPAYSLGKYDSTRCEPSSIERKIYNFHSHDDEILIADALEDVASAQDADPNELEDAADAKEWIEAKMGRAGQNRGLFDLVYFSRFNSSAGFRLSIDACCNLSTKKLSFCLFSLSPPASFYQEYQLSDEVQVTSHWDWNSLLKSPVFLNGYITFRELDDNEFMVAIIDVREVSRDDGGGGGDRAAVTPIGWTALPIFTSDGFVRTGCYQLPLFKGAVRTDLIEMLRSEAPEEVFAREQSKAANKARRKKKLSKLELLEPASVFVRLADAQLDALAPDFSWSGAKQLFIDDGRSEKYIYDPEEAGKGGLFRSRPKPLLSLLQDDEGSKQCEKAMRKIISTELLIEHLA